MRLKTMPFGSLAGQPTSAQGGMGLVAACCWLRTNRVADFCHMINYLVIIARCYKISSSCQLWMKLSSPRWLPKKPNGAKPRWVKLSRVPPKRWDTIHWNFITSRHFQINRRLCKRLHSKVTEAVQRVHQTLPSPCRSGLVRETTNTFCYWCWCRLIVTQ